MQLTGPTFLKEAVHLSARRDRATFSIAPPANESPAADLPPVRLLRLPDKNAL